MTFPTLRILLNLTLAILLFAAVLLAGRIVVSAIGAEPLHSNIEVVTDRPVERTVSAADGTPAGTLKLSHGTLSARVGGFAYMFQLIYAALILAAALTVIWQMRKVLIAIAAGKAFDSGTIRRLRLLGFLQLGTFVLIILAESLQQALILRSVAVGDGAVLLSSLSWSRPGVENIQIDYTLDFGWLFGGLVAFVIAEAFRHGAHYRDDSEAVV